MKSKQIRKVLPAVLGFVALAGASVTASAGLTVVNPVGNGGSERCLEGTTCPTGTSSSSYNGALSLVSVLSADVGGTLVRVSDFSSNLDSLWQNSSSNSGKVQARARYAGDSNSLFYTNTTGGPLNALTGVLPNGKVFLDNPVTPAEASSVHGSDFVNAPNAWVTIANGTQPFAFVLSDPNSGLLWSSNNTTSGPGSGSMFANSINGSGALARQDHMVTFQVYIGGVAQQDYFIGFEDRDIRNGRGGDHDYQDYVAEVKYVNAIPEPETYAMLLAGLGLMGFMARRRSRTA